MDAFFTEFVWPSWNGRGPSGIRCPLSTSLPSSSDTCPSQPPKDDATARGDSVTHVPLPNQASGHDSQWLDLISFFIYYRRWTNSISQHLCHEHVTYTIPSSVIKKCRAPTHVHSGNYIQEVIPLHAVDRTWKLLQKRRDAGFKATLRTDMSECTNTQFHGRWWLKNAQKCSHTRRLQWIVIKRNLQQDKGHSTIYLY